MRRPNESTRAPLGALETDGGGLGAGPQGPERIFRAPRFAEALAMVRRQMGPDAVVLSSRQVDGQVELVALPHQEAERLGLLQRRSRPASLLERRLQQAGLSPELSERLAREIRELHGGEPASLGIAREALEQALQRWVQVDEVPWRSRVVALVGPTGVGKTTTIAKLAAREALMHGRRVALVTLDTYRIAGAEQLEHYAQLIGVPIEVAHDARSFEIALRRLHEADLVLVDTAGRSPRDAYAIEALRTTLRGVEEPVAVWLCLAAATPAPELRFLVERHASLQPERLVSTKLDEAVRPGGVLTAYAESGRPLVWLTTGQRVPEDIEAPSAERLAGLLCGEGWA